jgi:hypothetical protein
VGDILPNLKVPELVALAREAYQDGCIANTMLELWVDEQLKFIGSKALLMLCGEAKSVPVGCQDCSICLEDETSNPADDHAVEIPSCSHAFHCKCIMKWFGRRFTCLMCR